MKTGKGSIGKISRALPFILLIAFACSKNPGIEVGNPDLKGKTYSISINGSDTSYTVQIVDEDTAVVSQINPNEFETVSVPYFQDENIVEVSASFSDGTQVEIQLTVDENGNLLGLEVEINGEPVSSELQVPDQPAGGNPREPGDAAMAIAESLCERVVSCNTSFATESCVAAIIAVEGLSQPFGGKPGQTLAEASAQIASGDLVVDEAALQECLAGISIVSCTQVQKDFLDGVEPNYNEITKLVPHPVCSPGILKPMPEVQSQELAKSRP